MSEHDACMFRTSSQTLGKIYKSNGIGSGIHTFSQYTKLAGQQQCVVSVPIEISLQPIPIGYITHNGSTYIHHLMHVLRYHSYPTDVPTIKYFHKYMVEHVIMLVTTTNFPLDR
jgi:hypothetical protein